MSPVYGYIFNLFLVLFLVFCNAFFVVSEFAIVKIRRTKLEELAHGGNKSAKIALKINEHMNTYLSAIQLGITLASLGLGWLGEPAVSRLLEDLFSDFFADKFGFLYFNISDSVFGVAIFGIILLAAVSLFVNKKISVGIISVFTVAAFLISGAFSFYDYSKNTYVTVTSGGGVVVYDKDAVLIVGFEDSSDCYALENITSSADDINTVALESLRCKKDIEDSFSNIQFVSDGGNIPYLCEHISAYYSGVDIIVTVHNNVFKITEDYVTINGYKVFRNVYDKFSEDENVTFVIDSVSQMQIRKD